MAGTRCSASGPIKPNTPLGTIHTTMRSIATAIKDATEATSYLHTKGWALPGEDITLEVLARTLFAAVADAENKLPIQTANPILAVAYLITENLEEGIKTNIARTITKHLLDSLIPITTDIQIKLDEHRQAVAESNKSHEALNEKLQQMQEKLDETSQKVTANAKTYSQAATAPPKPPLTPNLPNHPPSPIPHSRSYRFATAKRSKAAKSLSISIRTKLTSYPSRS